jgi:flavoprotein
VQYRNVGLARDTMTGIASGRGLEACDGCGRCKLLCRNQVQIGKKLEHLKTVSRDWWVA